MDKLIVNESSWHWRVFLGWERRKAADMARLHARDERQPFYTRKTLDLCRYFWTVVLFAPLRWFFQRRVFGLLAMVATAGLALVFLGICVYYIVLAVQEFGWLALLVVPGVVLGFLATAVAIVAVTGGAAYLIVERGNAGTKFKNSLPVQFVKAKKRRICPLIEVKP